VPVACCVLAALGWMGSLAARAEGAVGLVRQLLGDMEAKSAAAAGAAKAGVVVSEEEQREQELVSTRSICSDLVVCCACCVLCTSFRRVGRGP
jgi:hypothetical protein